MPKISVVIPVYNVEKTLPRCVDSVLAQTFSDYEIILVDDGSPDHSGRICDAYAEQDNRISVIHKENGGLSDARNAGLQKVCGEFVMFLDSDDYLTDNCLEELIRFDADIVIGSIYCQGANGKMYRQEPVADERISSADFKDRFPELLEKKRLNYVHAKLYRMSVIKEHHLEFQDDSLTSAEDTVFNFTLFPYCRDLYIVSAYVHYYTFNASGLGKRFFADRFARSKRLYRFLNGACQDLGIYTEQMHELLEKRFLRNMNALIRTMPSSEIPREEQIRILDDLSEDKELRCSYNLFPEKQFADVGVLLHHGGKHYLGYWKRSRISNKINDKTKRVTYLVKIYTTEIMYRLHLLKRPEE